MLRPFWCAKIVFATVVGLWLLMPGGAARGSGAREDTPMDSTELINGILKKMGSGEKIDPAEFKRFVDLQNADLKTGPAVGSKVPDFALEDQNGRRFTLHDLMGPKGMLLVFTRSADW
jgi:cytochrome oxidase Cu insertion factor (SCO1/SenC/PrrC family)